jgi:hypothetical protein
VCTGTPVHYEQTVTELMCRPTLLHDGGLLSGVEVATCHGRHVRPGVRGVGIGHSTHIGWGCQTGMVRSAVWTRSLS